MEGEGSDRREARAKKGDERCIYIYPGDGRAWFRAVAVVREKLNIQKPYIPKPVVNVGPTTTRFSGSQIVRRGCIRIERIQMSSFVTLSLLYAIPLGRLYFPKIIITNLQCKTNVILLIRYWLPKAFIVRPTIEIQSCLQFTDICRYLFTVTMATCSLQIVFICL